MLFSAAKRGQISGGLVAKSLISVRAVIEIKRSRRINSGVKSLIAASALALCLPAVASAATIINFENGYSDDEELTSPTELLNSLGNASGVTLTAPSGSMTVEATGSPGGDTIGFVNDTMRPNDTDDDATADLGNFFLRTTNALSGPLNTTPVFSLSFAGGASSVSGEIWDIDGTSVNNTEQWNVTANLLGGGSSSILSFLGSSNGSNTATSLDGKAWAFSFSGLGTITSVDFNFVGSETTGIGAAVDNLVIAPVPLPAGGLLLISGFAVAAAVRRRRKPAA